MQPHFTKKTQSLFEMKFTQILFSLLLFSVLSFAGKSAYSQTAAEGQKLFSASCTSCHAINEKVVGPALKDVQKRRDEAWLLKWIKNSQALIKSGDATANQLYKEYNNVMMTSFETLSDVQVKSILAYIKEESAKPVATASTTTATTNESNNSTESSSVGNYLLFAIIICLILIVARLFDVLMLVNKINKKPAVNWNLINGILFIAFLIGGLALGVWEFVVHGRETVFNFSPASEHGSEYDSMFYITLIITGIVFIITQILLFWFGYKYRYNKEKKALHYPDNHKLELVWTIVPAIVLTVLVVRGLITWNDIMYKSEEKSMNVELFGYQFGWTARYSGEDNILGKHDFRMVGVTNALGVDTTDEHAKDDIFSSELVLPVNRTIYFHFRSKDVIHSAYFPHFRAQMNVVPGLPTKFTFKPTVTTADMKNKMAKPDFEYALLCNKICGSAHYRMKMKITVVTENEYNKWISEQKTLVAKPNSTMINSDSTTQSK